MTVSLPSVKRSLFFFFCLKDAKILFTCKPSEVPWRWCSRQKGSPHYSTTHYPANLSINPRGREYHHPKDKKSNQGGVQINIQSALSTFFFFVPTFLPFRPGGGSLLAYVYEKHEIQNQIRCATTTSKFNVWTLAKSLPESIGVTVPTPLSMLYKTSLGWVAVFFLLRLWIRCYRRKWRYFMKCDGTKSRCGNCWRRGKIKREWGYPKVQRDDLPDHIQTGHSNYAQFFVIK